MELIPRFYDKDLEKLAKSGKVLVLYGPRQVGKTTMVKKFLSGVKEPVFMGRGEDVALQKKLENPTIVELKSTFGDYKYVFIDEAQLIKNVGTALKLMIDELRHLRIIVTGSSSLDLSNEVGEPLVGRQFVYHLFPISMIELTNFQGWFETDNRLEEFLIYGTYPEVLNSQNVDDKIGYLYQLRDSYLYKISILGDIRNSRKIWDLLKLVASQIGKEVSHQELAERLEMGKNTVAKYLDLLEKTFVLINVGGFSRNLRNEVTKTSRYYFYDMGVRNAVIQNFNGLTLRDDIGMLWENFIFIERWKKRHYQKIHATSYFWRTYNKKELDLVEERNGALYAYEIKWSKTQKFPPRLWSESYPKSEFECINRNNYKEFIL